MPVKTKDKYADDVANLGFDGIKKDNILFNAVSKALDAAKNKDQFNFLNDKNRDPQHLFDKYIKKANDLNIAESLVKLLKLAAEGAPTKAPPIPPDPAKFKGLMAKEVLTEARTLFKNNLKGALLTSEAFGVWVAMKQLESVKVPCETSAKKAAKILGIKDVKRLTEAFIAKALGKNAEAAKLVAEIEKAEKLKELMKALAKQGLA